MIARAQYFINERRVTKKELKRLRDEEIKTEYVAQKRLLNEDILTEYRIKNYIKQGRLTPQKHKGKVYFKKAEITPLLDELRIEARQSSLF